MLDSLSDFYWTYQNIIHGIAINGILGLSVYVVLSIGPVSCRLGKRHSWESARISARS
jgi:hypothetical protein